MAAVDCVCTVASDAVAPALAPAPHQKTGEVSALGPSSPAVCASLGCGGVLAGWGLVLAAWGRPFSGDRCLGTDRLGPCMGGVRTAPEEGGTMNTAVGVCLWLCSAAVVTGLTVLCNAGGAWMGGPAGHGSALATGGYLIFWAVFTFLSGTEGGRPLLQRILLIAGVVHLVSAAAGLLMGDTQYFGAAAGASRRRRILWPAGLDGMDGTLRDGGAALPAVGMLGKGQKITAHAGRR